MDSDKPTPTKAEKLKERDRDALRMFGYFLGMLGCVALLALLSFVGAYIKFSIYPMPRDL